MVASYPVALEIIPLSLPFEVHRLAYTFSESHLLFFISSRLTIFRIINALRPGVVLLFARRNIISSYWKIISTNAVSWGTVISYASQNFIGFCLSTALPYIVLSHHTF